MLFGTVCLSVLAALLRVLTSEWRQATREHRHAAELAKAKPTEVARAAVRDERRRLTLDIERGLRTHLATIDSLARQAAAEPDPTETLAGIHRASREASAELRRELGLLREDAAEVTESDHLGPVPISRAEVVLTVGVVILAVAEAIMYPIADDTRSSWIAVALTALAAAAFAGRRFSPGIAASCVGVTYLLGTAVDAHVEGGFWYLVTVGGLAWTLASRPALARRHLVGAAVLTVGIGLATWRSDPDNLWVNLVVLGVAMSGGLLARPARRRFRVAQDASAARAAALAEVAGVAIEGERAVFARDLHDVVSHAVGLIAVQAGAALVSWPRDFAAVTRALGVIGETSRSTLAELDHLGTDVSVRARDGTDLDAVAKRVRAAGTPVNLNCSAVLAGVTGETVYRVVQETLTNVVRHAPGAAATVSVDEVSGWVTVRVEDDGPGAAQGSLRGFGLSGLAERVGIAGGTLVCGKSDRGGFAVTVRLPRDREGAVT